MEWLPGNPEYELCGNAGVEWYDCVNRANTDIVLIVFLISHKIDFVSSISIYLERMAHAA